MYQSISKYYIKYVLFLVPALLFMACSQDNQKNQQKSPVARTRIVPKPNKNLPENRDLKDAPDFTLEMMDGEMFRLSDHEGKIIVLNIWATWCPPCRKEIPDFIEIQKNMRDEGVLFVGVALDQEGWKVVRPFAKKYSINYPVVVDNGTVRRKYGPFRGIPTTFIINREAKVAYVSLGMTPKSVLKPVLGKLVNKK